MNSEQYLVTKMINGDEASFELLFNLYVKKVYQFVVRVVKDRTEAEDITQDVFIKVWEHRNLIELEKSINGLIFTIAYRSTIDYLRKNKKRLQYTFGSGYLQETIISSISSDDLLNQHQQESLYEKAMQTLPPKRREIFWLSRHCGLTNKEIAEKLNISVKTVENQMTAALNKLREYFTDLEFSVILLCFFWNYK